MRFLAHSNDGAYLGALLPCARSKCLWSLLLTIGIPAVGTSSPVAWLLLSSLLWRIIYEGMRYLWPIFSKVRVLPLLTKNIVESQTGWSWNTTSEQTVSLDLDLDKVKSSSCQADKQDWPYVVWKNVLTLLPLACRPNKKRDWYYQIQFIIHDNLRMFCKWLIVKEWFNDRK